MNADADGPDPVPVPLSVLADLQAGRLDDADAAAVRRRIRDDADTALRMGALDRVRRDLAHLGTDSGSAPEVPPEVAARVRDALREEPPAHRVVAPPGTDAAHAARGPGPRLRIVAAAVGIGAALAAAGIGTAMLQHAPAHVPTTGPTAERITVSKPSDAIPLTNAQILDLLGQPPDLGPLADPQRRASCLSALGYPTAAPVLGAQPVAVGGRSRRPGAAGGRCPADGECRGRRPQLQFGRHRAARPAGRDTTVSRPGRPWGTAGLTLVLYACQTQMATQGQKGGHDLPDGS